MYNKNTDFVHLNLHSNFSLLSGADWTEDLVKETARLGMKALALTDINGLYAAVPFFRACQKHGVKPVIGVEIVEGNFKAVFLAKNRCGYSEICRLITTRHLEQGFSLTKAASEISDNVFLISGCREILEKLQGRRNVFVELQSCEGIDHRRALYRNICMSKELELNVVVTNNVYFIRKEGYRIHRLLSAIRMNKTIGTLLPEDVATHEHMLKAPQVMHKFFHEIPQALKNTVEIAEECEVDLELGTLKFPRFEIPEDKSAFTLLKELSLTGLNARYSMVSSRVNDTLLRELEIIKQLGLSEYFLIAWDIIRFAREKGMPCLGRGSAANSLVSYSLFITHVDPLAHNLFFERFLNLERAQLPDFDLDFGTDDREQVLKYIFKKYGERNVAMICTYSTLRARGAIREIAKAMGIPEAEIGNMVKKIPYYASTEDLEQIIKENPRSRSIPVHSEPFKSLLKLTGRIGNFPRHLSTHPCGIVVSPEPISNFIPLQRGDKGFEITQWSMYQVEDAGLIKLDILGQKGLAVISETIKAVESNYNKNIIPETISYVTDEKTKQCMKEGNTEGCFYIESPPMIMLITQAKCDDFEVLTALSSIIRPGVSNYGGKRQYLKRHLGIEPVTYLHPILEPLLCDSYGCLIYQEQVIRIAATMAGMSLGEADGLRRCMSKKRNWDRIEKYKEKFIEGAKANAISLEIIEEVFRQIESFAGYAFCKAHSASFALESFESMYWKAHYPAEFMAAVLSNQGGYYSTAEYIEEARRIGLEILLPSINHSSIHFKGKNRYIRIGLMQVKNLTNTSMKSIVMAKEKNGEFKSLVDFLRRTKIEQKETEDLIKCGAFDGLGRTRPEHLWILKVISSKIQEEKKNPVMSFDREDAYQEILSKIPSIPDYNFKKKLEMELQILDITVSAHPFALFRERVDWIRKKRPIIPACILKKYNGQNVYILGWKVASKPTRTKDDNKLMEFITFSDETGRFEATLFPEVYDHVASELLKGKGPFLIFGRVEIEFGYPSLMVEKLALI